LRSKSSLYSFAQHSTATRDKPEAIQNEPTHQTNPSNSHFIQGQHGTLSVTGPVIFENNKTNIMKEMRITRACVNNIENTFSRKISEQPSVINANIITLQPK
jgi:hypothetical protein